MRTLFIIMLVFIGASWSLPLFAEDYSFEIPEKESAKEEKTLEWSGNLDGKYMLFHPQESSPIYSLQFVETETSSDYLSQYQLSLYLDGDYQTKDIGFHLKTYIGYFNETEEATFDLFELYGNLNLSLSSFVQAGKIRYNWGKGYAFNPVGFVNPFKDPENPELAQAGVLSANVEMFKSLDSDILRTAALTGVVVPPREDMNGRFAEAEQTDLAAKLYLMSWTIDLDLMGYYSEENPKRIGADFAVNLREDLEIHGEGAYFQDVPKNTIVNNQLQSDGEEGYEYLLGLRWLNQWEITTILEYYHTDAGLTQDEFEEYLSFFQWSLDSGREELIGRARSTMQNNFQGRTLMQDYVYLNVQKPEPFDWLYFTPSVSAIYNVHDQSVLLTCTLSYQPFTNFEFLFKSGFMIGEDDSEYGSQQFDRNIETWLRFHF